ncbi:MAG TPA: tetratricopeptide repeat protein, partial [Myxococcaceae bacterium]|nr:tetratricopeptide repeat protein [Myxococcaceae bacterium]
MTAKSLVDRYEQMLAQDPTSTVFVELAKAYVSQGAYDRAVEVCKTGLKHHRGSVLGRVLWGKALISMGKPGEAMEQFDQAVLIDRENPHAYNLISEVLLRKGLYRSALPLLRKAAALQPDNGRIRQWLSETQRVLAGGAAPELEEGPEESALPAMVPAATLLPMPDPEAAAPGELPDFESEQTVQLTLSDAEPPPESGPARTPSLLDEIPDMADPSAAPEAAEPAVTTQMAQSIASQYEQELRKELAHSASQKSFLARHGWKLAVSSVLTAALVAGSFAFITTRAKNQGRDLPSTLALAKKTLNQDTAASYREALDALTHAVEMDSRTAEA